MSLHIAQKQKRSKELKQYAIEFEKAIKKSRERMRKEKENE